MSVQLPGWLEASEARAEICRELSRHLYAAADVCEAADLEGWAHHLRRDAELLSMRADREEDEHG